MGYYSLIYANGIWAAYSGDNSYEYDVEWICWNVNREACIAKVEAMGYVWEGL